MSDEKWRAEQGTNRLWYATNDELSASQTAFGVWGELAAIRLAGMLNTLEAENAALKAENERLKSMAPYVESSGHYCDGMTAAWSDAQEAIGQVAALKEQVEGLAKDAAFLLSAVKCGEDVDSIFEHFIRERIRVARTHIATAEEGNNAC